MDKDVSENTEADFIFNGNAGLTIFLGSFVNINASMHNILGKTAATSSDVDKIHAPIAYQLGIEYRNENIGVYLNTTYLQDTSELNWRVGVMAYILSKNKKPILKIGAGSTFLDGLTGISPFFILGVRVLDSVIDYSFSIPLNMGGAGNHSISMTFDLLKKN